MSLVELAGLGLRFGAVEALRDCALAIQPGERVALLGPSGCGKSSVLRLIAGLLQPSAGRLQRREPLQLGCVFQQPRLLPWASVSDNVALPLTLAGAPREAVAPLLAQVGLQGFEAALPHELSGGMQMRAALARALVTTPELLLLDEPFAALDDITRQRLGAALLDWQAEHSKSGPGLALLLVTHNVFEAVALADRVLVMSARPGRVILELDVKAQRTAQDWPLQDAYFALVREARLALEERA